MSRSPPPDKTHAAVIGHAPFERITETRVPMNHERKETFTQQVRGIEKRPRAPKKPAGMTGPTKERDETKQRGSGAVFVLAWLKLLSKIAPFTKKPGRERSKLVSDIDFPDLLPQAKAVALLFKHPDPEWFKSVIEVPTLVKHKKFFIDLGKCLSGEINPELWDKRDIDIAEIVVSNPRMRAKEAVRELVKRGHRPISEENFRNWKSKLLRAKREYEAFREGRWFPKP